MIKQTKVQKYYVVKSKHSKGETRKDLRALCKNIRHNISDSTQCLKF